MLGRKRNERKIQNNGIYFYFGNFQRVFCCNEIVLIIEYKQPGDKEGTVLHEKMYIYEGFCA